MAALTVTQDKGIVVKKVIGSPSSLLIAGIQSDGAQNVEEMTSLEQSSASLPSHTARTFVSTNAPATSVTPVATPKQGDKVKVFSTDATPAITGYSEYVYSGSSWLNATPGTHRVVGVGSKASNSGTGGTVTIAGLAATDLVVGSLIGTWNRHTAGLAGASIASLTVHTAGTTVTYTISGTAAAAGGTAGGIRVVAYRSAVVA